MLSQHRGFSDFKGKKALIILLGILFTFTNVFSRDGIRENQVPEIVKKILYKTYPKAKYVEWEYKNKRNYNYYEAEFRIENLEYEMRISTEGKLIYSKRDINLQDIPQKISDYINKEYNNPRFLGAEFIYTDGVEEYQVGIRFRNSFGNHRYLNLYFTKDGVYKKKG